MVNTLTRSTSRSRRCLLQQESCAGVHLLRSKRTIAHSPGPPAQKRKNHTDDRREQLRRGSEDQPCTHWVACSSIDRRRWRFLLIYSSLSGIIQSTTELFWNLRLCSFEWSPCIVPGNREKVHWGEGESLKRPRISALASSGEEKRRSIEVIVYYAYASWRDAGCAGLPKQNGETAANLLNSLFSLSLSLSLSPLPLSF